MNLGCFWAQFNFLLGQTSPWVWIWDPGDLLSSCCLSFATCNILDVLRLLLGKLIIATFYEES
ncbi:hypothetical protein RchiOBHm_Chr1g0337161 [Rosa chinensis]|uniref:Uncharacterized protein n=1 Tax=Rosa chinensis TaxID=74649 RepID=A0A2P6SCW2_ROSCH|nr:hypothetical protein RchiOBHm_Chr1g0337161 [Rosa chinensis]